MLDDAVVSLGAGNAGVVGIATRTLCTSRQQRCVLPSFFRVVYRKYMSRITTDHATKTNDQSRHYTPLSAQKRAQVYDPIKRQLPKTAKIGSILLKLG